MSRVDNRLREHSGIGHRLVNIHNYKSIFQPGNILFDCKCGWQGWLPKNALDMLASIY